MLRVNSFSIVLPFEERIIFIFFYKTNITQTPTKVNKNVGFFYNETNESIASNNSVAVSGTGNSVNSISERFISLLEQKDIQMNRLISLLEERKG